MGRKVPVLTVWGDNSNFRWNIKAANGEVIAQGEGHTTLNDARRAALGLIRTIVRGTLRPWTDTEVTFSEYRLRDKDKFTGAYERWTWCVPALVDAAAEVEAATGEPAE